MCYFDCTNFYFEKESEDEDVYDEEGVKTGTIHHDAEYETKWVEDTPAYDVCTVCGATKE